MQYTKEYLPQIETLAGETGNAIKGAFTLSQGSAKPLLDNLTTVATVINNVESAANKLGGNKGIADAYKTATLVGVDAAKAVNFVGGLFGGGSKKPDTTASDAATAAAARASAAAAIQAASNAAVAATLGVTADAYGTAKTAADQQASSTAQATLQMQLQNNAAGLLNQALNSLSGQNLSVAQAQTAMDSAILTGTQTLEKNKGTLDEHTQAGIEDRQALEGMASALRGKAQADAAAGDSTEKVTATYNANADALLAQIAKTDGAGSSAYLYAQQLLKIPPVVKTQVDLDADAAKAAIAALTARIALGVSINVNGISVDSTGKGFGLVKAAAAGGYITGPGTGTSDSIAARLSNGEFVMPADRTSQYRSVLEAMRNGTLGSATLGFGASSAPVSSSMSPSRGSASSAAPPITIVVQSLLDGQVVATSVNKVNAQTDAAGTSKAYS